MNMTQILIIAGWIGLAIVFPPIIIVYLILFAIYGDRLSQGK